MDMLLWIVGAALALFVALSVVANRSRPAGPGADGGDLDSAGVPRVPKTPVLAGADEKPIPD